MYRFTGVADTGIEDNVVINECSKYSEVVNNSNIAFFIGVLSKINKVNIC